MNDTKEYILKTSFSLFLHHSFKEVTMKDIVEKTGLSKGAFYHYFESKEQLFTEVVAKYLTRAMFFDFDSLDNTSLYNFYRDYLDKFGTVFANLKEILSEEWSGINYYLLFFDAIKIIPDFRVKIVEGMDYELGKWEKIIKFARNNGEIESNMTDEQIARVFISSTDGFAMKAIMHGDLNLVEEPLKKMWNSFYNDIKK
jgi:TetR/AcrR family transcriptional regulator, transcriptional repressor for nem operon